MGALISMLRQPREKIIYGGPGDDFYSTDEFLSYMTRVQATPVSWHYAGYGPANGAWEMGRVQVEYSNDNRLLGATAVITLIGPDADIEALEKTIKESASHYVPR